MSNSTGRLSEEPAVLVWKVQRFESQYVIGKVTLIQSSVTLSHQNAGVWMKWALRCLGHVLLPEILSTVQVGHKHHLVLDLIEICSVKVRGLIIPRGDWKSVNDAFINMWEEWNGNYVALHCRSKTMCSPHVSHAVSTWFCSGWCWVSQMPMSWSVQWDSVSKCTELWVGRCGLQQASLPPCATMWVWAGPKWLHINHKVFFHLRR